MNWMTGFHAVEEALAAGRPLDRIVIARGRHGDRVEAVVRLAKSRSVPVRFEDRQQLDRLAGTREHQGIAALAAAKPAVEREDLLREKDAPGLLVLLDGIEDPHLDFCEAMLSERGFEFVIRQPDRGKSNVEFVL